jgi:hypothetical protein
VSQKVVKESHCMATHNQLGGRRRLEADEGAVIKEKQLERQPRRQCSRTSISDRDVVEANERCEALEPAEAPEA